MMAEDEAESLSAGRQCDGSHWTWRTHQHRRCHFCWTAQCPSPSPNLCRHQRWLRGVRPVQSDAGTMLAQSD
jgi:hypothetical protein